MDTAKGHTETGLTFWFPCVSIAWHVSLRFVNIGFCCELCQRSLPGQRQDFLLSNCEVLGPYRVQQKQQKLMTEITVDAIQCFYLLCIRFEFSVSTSSIKALTLMTLTQTHTHAHAHTHMHTHTHTHTHTHARTHARTHTHAWAQSLSRSLVCAQVYSYMQLILEAGGGETTAQGGGVAGFSVAAAAQQGGVAKAMLHPAVLDAVSLLANRHVGMVH